MLIKIFSTVILASALSSAGSARSKTSTVTKNPIKYATQVSQSFAEGDSNDASGWSPQFQERCRMS